MNTPQQGMILKKLLFGSVLLGGSVAQEGAYVSSVSPGCIGYGGGAITILGDGFATDGFSQFDPTKGNQVSFANEYGSISCQNPINWNFLLENPQDPNSQKITCDLPPKPPNNGGDFYYLTLLVDGKEVPNTKTIRYCSWKTPYLRRVKNRYGKPGDLITLIGQTFTKEYGNSNFKDDSGSSGVATRREDSITGVVVGQRECELTDSLGNVYGIKLDNPQSGNEGNITCRPGGTFIGAMNATFFVSGDKGKSLATNNDDAYSVNSKGELFTYHTLPEITALSPNVGGINGRTHLNIKGNSFDAYPGKTKVMVGKTECEIVNINSTDLTCLTPKQSEIESSAGGPRGMLYEAWVTTVSTDYSTLSTSAADYRKMVTDNSTVRGPKFLDQTKGFTARLRGLFVAPYTGNVSFYLHCTGNCSLNWSNNSDSTNTELLLNWPTGNTVQSVGHVNSRSRNIFVEKGEEYYLEALQTQPKENQSYSFLQISLWEHDTIYYRDQTNQVEYERQGFQFHYQRNLETQRIKINSVTGVSEITFTQAGKESAEGFPIAEAAAKSEWMPKFEDMLMTKCEALRTGVRYIQDYENELFKLNGAGGYMNPRVEPYCGKRSLERQTRLMHLYGKTRIDANRYKFLCFAVKGINLVGSLNLLVWYQRQDNDRTQTDWITIPDLWEPSFDWQYNCFNWAELIRNSTLSGLTNLKEGTTYLEIEDIITPTWSNQYYWYHDEFSITEEAVQMKRVLGSVPSEDVKIQSVSVTYVEDISSFDVKINPLTCNEESDDFELFGIKDATIVGLDLTEITDTEAKNTAIRNYLQTQANVTYTKSDWGGGTVTIQRIEKGSRRPTGNYSLSYKGITVENLSMDLQDYELRQILESKFGLYGVTTYYWGWECYDKYIMMDFRASTPTGNIDDLSIDNSNLVIDHGKYSNIRVQQREQGGIMIETPGGDFFRLETAEPIVSVYVNDFLSSCTSPCVNMNQDCNRICKFQFSESATPSVSSISGAEENGDTTLTIQGSQLSEDVEDFEIKVGKQMCKTTTASLTEIKCILEPGPAGEFDVSVIVKSKGEATQPSPGLKYQVSLTVLGNTPDVGSVGGGTLITIDGRGFPNSVDEWETCACQLAVAGQVCVVKESKFNEVKCMTTEGLDGNSGPITATVYGETASGGSFRYDASVSPSISSYSPLSASALGGGTLTISGNSFGAKWGKVLIGDAGCSIVTWMNTGITCSIPPNKNGQHKVKVQVPDNGIASTAGVPDFEVNFKITNVIPRRGSVLGGTIVQIIGIGFGNCSDIDIHFGTIYECTVTSCSDTEIKCITERIKKTHIVTNGGKHPSFGIGYAWTPSEAVVMPGDTIQWTWTLQTSLPTTGINILQTSDPLVDEYNGSGFKSGEKKPSGIFSETFTASGDYYYTSDPVKSLETIMRGTVKVASTVEDQTHELKILLGEVEADHDISGASSGTIPTGSSCTISEEFNCATDPVISDTFTFLFSDCLTPKVNKIEITEGQYNDTKPNYILDGSKIKLEGEGFSSTLCQNEVKIGDHACNVDTSSSTMLECTFNGNSGEINPMESLENYEVSIRVLNKGSSVFTPEDTKMAKLLLFPQVITTNIIEGSWAGGMILVLSGKALLPHGGKDVILVTFGDEGFQASCTIISVSFDDISCLVPDYTPFKGVQTDQTVPIKITLGYDQIEPKVDSQITFTFKQSLMSNAATISSTVVTSTSDVLTITGTNFGSTVSKVKVYAKLVNNLSRRRRQIPEPEEEIPSNGTKKDNWEKMGAEIWRCPNGLCSTEEVTGNVTDSPSNSRVKRQTYPNFNFDMEVSEQEDKNTTMTICQNNPDDCFVRLMSVMNYVKSPSRRKRSVDINALLEMSPLAENSKEGEVTTVTDTSISFSFTELPAGEYNIVVNIDGGVGNAVVGFGTITSQMLISAVNPSSGSIHGGHLISIIGSGFSGEINNTVVTFGSSNCTIVETSASLIKCRTEPCSGDCAELKVSSNLIEATSTYSQDVSKTPTVTSVSELTSTQITISGTDFGASPSVSVGKHLCTVDTATNTEIKCTLPLIGGGAYPIKVESAELGYSNSDQVWNIQLDITSVSPATGSFGGGALITIVGEGFDSSEATVSVCGNACTIQQISTTEIQCLTPANDDTSATLLCDIILSQESGDLTKSSIFTYDVNLTPEITAVSPLRGGTGGGTLITITGTGFAESENKVSIDDVICDIATESATIITCYTNYHNGAIEAPVIVDVQGKGYGRYQDIDLATFYYIDRWSSIWTWGGLGTPLEGEFIVITPGMTILLDTDTPVLKFLLINGGTLLFDEEQPNLELQAEYILIVGGGSLQIGTEEKPYESNAVITMHGNVRCIEMPVFGCKVIGVREGSLDLHGKYIPVTWTHLSETVEPGSTEIKLKQPVTWQVGDHIVLATTGDRNSMKENEEHYIQSISDDGHTITLQSPLKYRHISIEQTFGDKVVETRGEVALLNRNVLVKGTINEQFKEVLPACEEPFNSGAAFSDSLQTCFAGKFGEELGSDEMGAVIIISPKYKNQGLVEARFSYIELTSVGQAFRVGRYPIHFHLPGVQSESYVRGVSIHHSNNRACTLHDVSNITIEHNVAYNIKGLTFFLEDGIEMHNTLQYNLAVFTRMSNSLLNPDINPASFWIVNPLNKFIHNSCAGSTHVCFWLRPASVPDGPSYTQRFCPFKVPFGEFHNNTAHSMGWYGFWIFGQSNHATYDPHTGTVEKGFCNGYRTQARIGSFTTWNNKRGFEIVSGANIRLENQTHMDHDFSAYEIFTGRGPYGPGGAGIFNSLIVGHSKVSELTTGKQNACTPIGINLPPKGYTLENITFYNFDKGPACRAIATKFEEKSEAALAIRVSGLQFFNTTHRQYTHPGREHGVWYKDIDGSLTGTVGASLVTKSGTNPTDLCTDDASGFLGGGITSSVCDSSVNFHKIKINKAAPSSLEANKIVISNQYGQSERQFLWLGRGWEALLPQGPVNKLAFNTAEHLTNISYYIEAFGMHTGENFLILGHDLTQQPDRFNIFDNSLSNYSASLQSPPTFENSENGDWYFNNETGTPLSEVQYIFSSKGQGRSNWWKKRATEESQRSGDLGVWTQNDVSTGTFSVIRCENEGCIPTPPPTMDPNRPESFISWSNPQDWVDAELLPPTGNDEVSIPRGAWVVLDTNPPKFKRLYVYGTLEVQDTEDRRLEVEILLVMGGRLIVGEENNRFQHNFELYLHGNHYTTDQPMFNAPNLGAKALGVYGDSIRDLVYPGLIEMFGRNDTTSWGSLAKTANIGETTIEVEEEPGWKAGDKLVITATNYESLETEKRVIESINGKIITLTSPLEFTHLSVNEDLPGGSGSFTMKARVGLLSRNVRIIGAEYDEQEEQMFGARVIAAAFVEGGIVKPGYVKLSNVEFYKAGQEGYSDNYDPRYSLAIVNSAPQTFELLPIGEITSFVKDCSFDYNYNSGIGVFESDGVAIENNVIFRHINDGILDESKNTKIVGNLVTMGESINQIKNLRLGFDFRACINIMRGTGTILMNNVMAGCAQGGLNTRGNPCDVEYSWRGNEIFSTQHAIHLNSKGLDKIGCVNIKNFFVWRNFEYGLMVMSEDNVEVEDLTIIESGLAVMFHGIGPSALDHIIDDDRHMSLTKSVIVANSAAFQCTGDEPPSIMSFSPEAKRAWTGRKAGITHTGLLLPIFQSKFPMIDFPHHVGVKSAEGSNPTLRGILYMDNVTFVNFDGACGKKDIVMKTNTGEDDVNWPVRTSNLKFLNVNEEFKVLYNRPLASKINPSDCTDFDCDGMKKALIVDLDGTLIGESGGTIIPDSAFEWDGNPKNGLGYYRVPKPMVTETNGDRISYASKMPNTGIYRTDQCTWVSQWTAYKCSGINHKLLIIESMDRDRRIRRLGPIAVLANAGPNGYIDLVNGPQDHSCCSGYICAERLSTFYTMVATEQEYEIVMSSIPPQVFRFHLLHNEESHPVRVKMWFPKQQRLDIYTGGDYIPPNNKDFSVIDNLKLFPADDKYIPEMADQHCSNYFDPNTGHLYLLIKEKSTCDIKTQPVVVLKLGITIREDEFFDEDKIVGNIAGLLGIPLNKIRVTNIVREGSVRKRRSTETPGVEFQIAEPPAQTAGSIFENNPLPTSSPPVNPNAPTESPTSTTTSTTTAPPVIPSDILDYTKLVTIVSKVTTLLQTGKLSDAIGVEVTSMTASKPIDPPEPEPAYTSPEERSVVLDKTFAQQSLEADQAKLEELNSVDDVVIPKNLVIGRQIYDVYEMAKAEFPAYVYLTTEAGDRVEVVGGEGDPWLVTASLVTGPEGAELVNNVTVPFEDGFANFTDLAFSKMGEGYSIQFSLTYPDGMTIAPVTSQLFNVGPRPLGVKITGLTEQVPDETELNVTFVIHDLGLDTTADPDVIGSINWDCSLGWSVNIPVGIEGAIQSTIAAGNNTGEIQIKFLSSKTDVLLEIECTAQEEERTLIGRSSSFNIYPASSAETELKTTTTAVIKFSGPFSFIKSLVDAVPALAIEECSGVDCPEAPTRKRRQVEGGIIPQIGVVQSLDISRYQEQSNPLCIRPTGAVSC